MPNSPDLSPAPPPDVLKTKEILHEKDLGLQTAFLLDGKMPSPSITKDEVKQGLKSAKEQIDQNSFRTDNLTKNSRIERDDFWDNSGVAKDQQMAQWLQKTDEMLKSYRNTPEGATLKKLGFNIDNDHEAQKIYDEYFSKDGKGKGDIGYFASKVASNIYINLKDQATLDLVTKIGKWYGEDSQTVIRHLTTGIKNVKTYHSFDEFSDKAANAFKNMSTTPDPKNEELLNRIRVRSESADKKQQEEEEEKQKQKVQKKEVHQPQADEERKKHRKKRLG